MLSPAFFSNTPKPAGPQSAIRLPGAMLAAALSLLTCADSQAQSAKVLAGLQASPITTYAFVEQAQPFEGGTLDQGWYHKVRLTWLRNNYNVTENNADVEVNARTPGLDAGVGYSWKNEVFKLDLSASAGYRYLSVKPHVPADEKTGGTLTLKPQLFAKLQFNSVLDADLIAYNTIGTHSSFVRTRLGVRPQAGWRIGAETMQQNGSNFRTRGTGLFAATALSKEVGVELNAGRVHSSDGQDTNYIGVGFSRMY